MSSFEANGETRLEFPVVAVNVDDPDAADYEIQRVHDVELAEETVNKVRAWAYDYVAPTECEEGERVGTLITEADGEYNGAQFAQFD